MKNRNASGISSIYDGLTNICTPLNGSNGMQFALYRGEGHEENLPPGYPVATAEVYAGQVIGVGVIGRQKFQRIIGLGLLTTSFCPRGSITTGDIKPAARSIAFLPGSSDFKTKARELARR